MNNKEEYITTPTQLTEEFFNENNLSDDDISICCSGILSNPTIIYESKETSEQNKFYSKKQMIEMFKFGFVFMTKLSSSGELGRKKIPRLFKPYQIVRDMNVGDTRRFAYQSWGAVRSAASKLKREFGVKYQVKKVTGLGEVADIEVKRIK